MELILSYSQTETETDLKDLALSQSRPGKQQTLTPPGSALDSQHIKYIQDLQTPLESPYRSDSNLPTLSRRSSLPNLNTLRQLRPVAALTAANLAAMDPQNPPTTPACTVSRKSRSSKSSAITKTPRGEDGFKMGLYGLLDENAGKQRLSERADFHAAVRSVIGEDRGSIMRPGSVKKFAQQLQKVETRNEATISARLMPFFIKEERTMPGSAQEDPFGPSENEQEHDVGWELRRDEGGFSDAEHEARRAVLRAFDLDHLDNNTDRDFARDSVPFPPNERKSRSECGIKNPKPDITYGISRDAFTEEELKTLIDFEPDISKGIISPFLVIEWKGFDGSMISAKEQTRRAGAAMVYSRRQASARLAMPPQGDALDLATMVFSCVMNEQGVHISVHWAEEVDEKMKWFVAILEYFNLKRDEDVPMIRRALHNIIDWGIDVRKTIVKDQLAQYQRELDHDSETPGPPTKRRRGPGES